MPSGKYKEQNRMTGQQYVYMQQEAGTLTRKNVLYFYRFNLNQSQTEFENTFLISNCRFLLI